MAEESSPSLEGKCLSTLRVVDLKMELEKRGLSKSGSKKDLIKRLKQKLELEKLLEETAAVGTKDVKLQLDEATEQNEFVKQYLAEQQKIFASQREARRLIELQEHEGTTEDSDSCPQDQIDEIHVIKDRSDKSAILKNIEPNEQEKDNSVQSTNVDSVANDDNDDDESVKTDLMHIDKKLEDDVCEKPQERDKHGNVKTCENVCDSTTLPECEETENKSEFDKTNIPLPEESKASCIYVKEPEVAESQEQEVLPKSPSSEKEEDNIVIMPREKKIKASQEPVAYSLADICLPESSKIPESQTKIPDKFIQPSKSLDTEDDTLKTNGTPPSSETKSSRRKRTGSRFSTESVIKNSVNPVVEPQTIEQKESEGVQEEKMDASDVLNVHAENLTKEDESNDNDVSVKLPKDDLEKIPHSPEPTPNEPIRKSRHSPVRTKDKSRESKLKTKESKLEKEVHLDEIKKRRTNSENETINKAKQSESRNSRQRIKEKISKKSSPKEQSSSSSRSSSSSSASSSSSSSSSNSETKTYKRKQDKPVSHNKTRDYVENRTRNKQRSSSKERERKRKLDKSPVHSLSSDPKEKFKSKKSFSRSRSRDSSEKEHPKLRKISDDQSSHGSKDRKLTRRKSDEHIKKTDESDIHVHSPPHSSSSQLSRRISKEGLIDKRKYSRSPSPSPKKESNRSISHSSSEHSDSASDSDNKTRSRVSKEKDTQEVLAQPKSEEKESQEDVEHFPSKQAKVEAMDTGEEDMITAEIERSDEILQDREESQTDDNQDVDMKEEGELGSEENTEAETPPAKISYRKLNVPFKRSESKDKPQRRRRWCVENTIQKSTVNISSESLKNLIPNFKLVCPKPKIAESENVSSKLESVEKPAAETERKSPRKSVSKSTNSSTIDDVEEKGAFSCALLSSALSAFHKKKVFHKKHSADIGRKKDDIKKEKLERFEKMEDDSPFITKSSVKPASCIVYIQNLVRPFTLQQLKDMLAQTGTIVEDGFWIDKIKSKCFVKYDKLEDAMKTRELLDGSKWPLSNPKILVAEFATQEEFDLHAKAYEFPKPPPGHIANQEETRKRDEPRDASDVRKRLRRIERHSREREREHDRDRSKNAFVHVREWDKDKISQDSPERENIRPHREMDRSSERKKDKKESKKKPIEETPAKLLDDLFQKTKTTPCIYWLPLTEEQAKKKEEERRQRRLDREKRNQQEEAERQARRKQRERASRSRSRSRTGRRR